MRKKIIMTESQVKNLVDNLISEQAEGNSYMMGVQDFLKTILKINLAIDGKTGRNSQTEAAIKKYQQMIGVWPVDGIWGEMTMEKMPENHKKLFDKCQTKYLKGYDKVISKIFK